MAEATQGSPAEPEQSAPASSPALTAEQVSEIVTAAIDARVPGLMSTYDKQIASVKEDLRRATMTPDELDDERERASASELEALRRQNAILAMTGEYPEAVKAYLELQNKDDGKAQLEYLQSLIAQAAAPTPPPTDEGDDTEDELEVPDVDPNRAAPVPDAAMLEADEKVLGAFDAWPKAPFWRRG